MAWGHHVRSYIKGLRHSEGGEPPVALEGKERYSMLFKLRRTLINIPRLYLRECLALSSILTQLARGQEPTVCLTVKSAGLAALVKTMPRPHTLKTYNALNPFWGSIELLLSV